MQVNQKVLVFTDGLVGWELGKLKDRYNIIRENDLERWGIETTTGTNIVRYVENKKHFWLKDGCGYILEEGKKIKAAVNFDKWDIEAFAESWDDPEYFRNIFLDKQEEIYDMRWDGQGFFELLNVEDEREGTLFEPHDLIIIEI